MAKKTLACLRCGTDMHFVGAEKFQLGQTGWILGDLPNLIAGALEIDIYSCPACGKLEFYQSEMHDTHEALRQVRCPDCGKLHDFDYPKCPFCGHENF